MIFYIIRAKVEVVDGVETNSFRIEKEGYDLTGLSFLKVNDNGMHEYVPTEEVSLWQTQP